MIPDYESIILFIDFKFIPKLKETLSFSSEELELILFYTSLSLLTWFVSDLWLLFLLVTAFLTAATFKFSIWYISIFLWIFSNSCEQYFFFFF